MLRIIRQRKINANSIDRIKSLPKRIDWDLVKQNNSTNDAYNIFVDLFTVVYDQVFPEIEIKMKTEKKPLSHRIAKGIESPIKEYKNYMENF